MLMKKPWRRNFPHGLMGFGGFTGSSEGLVAA
jgi:hypothetical protein